MRHDEHQAGDGPRQTDPPSLTVPRRVPGWRVQDMSGPAEMGVTSVTFLPHPPDVDAFRHGGGETCPGSDPWPGPVQAGGAAYGRLTATYSPKIFSAS